MKYVIAWTPRVYGSGLENEQTIQRNLQVFAQWSPPADITFHEFVNRVDGGGGFAVVETDDALNLLETTAKFVPYHEFTIYPVVEISDAEQAFQRSVEFRDSTV
jgi:hypothetical protein